jgi:hypothetical protein
MNLHNKEKTRAFKQGCMLMFECSGLKVSQYTPSVQLEETLWVQS